MPVVATADGEMYVSLEHMGGITPLMHALPIYTMLVSILALNDKIGTLKAWYIPAGGIGLLMTALTIAGATAQLENTALLFGKTGNSNTPIQTIWSIGGYIMLFSSMIYLIFPLLAKAPPSEESQVDLDDD